VQAVVYAGLIGLDNRILNIIPTADLCQYFSTWSSSLQSNNRYATSTSIENCKKDCRALLWPGGMETIRQVSPYLNNSIFYGGHFNNVDAVRVDHAPGIITTFRSLNPNFTFDLDQDCIFGGQLNNDSLMICNKQVGHSMAVGKCSWLLTRRRNFERS
jgi:hypothetical protein